MKPWPTKPIRGKRELPCTMLVIELDEQGEPIGYRRCGARAKVILRDEAMCVRCLDAHWQDTGQVKACELHYGEPHG